MAKTYNKMLLDINEKPSDIITAVQNDTNSRYLDVNLYDNGVPINLTGCEVKIFMNKPENGGEIWNDGVITEAENGRCEFLLTTEALAKMGHLQVQISIWKDNTEILSSQIFEIYVTESLLGESSVESSNEYGTLVVLFQNLYEAYDLMTTMVQNIGKPDEVAAQYDLATMWQAWEFLVAYMKGDLTDKINEALANASVQGVLDKIGATTDTGGSSTSGTVMAKENAALKNIDKLYNTVLKKQCVASDNVLHIVRDTETSSGAGTRKTVGKCLVSSISGTIKVTASIKTGKEYNFEFRVLKNGEEVKSMGGTSPATYTTVTSTIDVSEGDMLEFTMYCNMYSSYCNLITICGTVVELEQTKYFVSA